MRADILNYIWCPICNGTSLDLEIFQEDAFEIRDGKILCCDCGNYYEIRQGIVDLL